MAEDFFADITEPEPERTEGRPDILAVPERLRPPVRFVPQGVPREPPPPPPPPAPAQEPFYDPMTGAPVRVPGQVVQEPPGKPGFVQGLGEGLGSAVSGAAETGEAMVNRLRGRPLAEPTESFTTAPEVAELPPSQGMFHPYWWGHMLGHGAPAMAAYALPGGAIGAGLATFITEYGPSFRANVEAGVPEDQALRTALQSSGVNAAATAAMFGLPLRVFTQLIGQPTVGGAAQILQNYIAGLPPEDAFRGVGEAMLAGLFAAAPVVAGKGIARVYRRVRGKGAEPKVEGEPEAPPAEPEAPSAEPAAEVPAKTPAAKPAEEAPPTAPTAPTISEPSAPARAPTDADLFDWMVRTGGEGEPPTAAPVQVAAAAPIRVAPPRVEPRVEPPRPPPAEPPRAREPVPEARPEERAPERPAEPPRAQEPDYFSDIGEPPDWVTERLPEPRGERPPEEQLPYDEAAAWARRPEAPEPPRAREPAPKPEEYRPRGALPPAEEIGQSVQPIPGFGGIFKVGDEFVLRDQLGKELGRYATADEARNAARAPPAEEPVAPPQFPEAPAPARVRGAIPGLAPPKGGRAQSLMDFIRQHGIDPNDPMIGDVQAMNLPRGYIRKGGKPLDTLLEAAVEARYIDDPGFRGGGERTSTVDDLLAAMDKDHRARKAKNPEQQVWPQGEEVMRRPGAEERQRSRDLDTTARSIEEAFEKEGISRNELDPNTLRNAAEAMYRREPGYETPLEAYDRAAAWREEVYGEKRTGVRGGREKVYPGGEPRAEPRGEEAPAGPRPREQGPGKARELAREEVRPEALEFAHDVARRQVGREIDFLDSMPLSRVLAGLDFSHLSGAALKTAEWVRNRLTRLVGDTPVHFVAERDIHEFAGHTDPKARVNGFWAQELNTRTSKPDSFIFLNADMMYAGNKAEGVHTVLHEATHAATNAAIDRNAAVRRSIQAMMTALKGKITKGGKPIYAMTDVHEFIAEVFSNPQLQEAMHGVQTPSSIRAALGWASGKGLSMWDAMVETVRRAIGLPPRLAGELDKIMQPTLLETALTVGETALQAREKMEAPARRAMAREREEPRFEPGAEGKPQQVIPGAERRVGEALQRKAEAPLKPKVEQKGMDFGLFGDERNQGDLFGGRDVKGKALIVDAANEALTDKLRMSNHPTLSKIAGYLPRYKHYGPTEVRVRTQDYFLRWRRAAEQWMRDNAGKILPDWANPYQAEALSHGKAKARLEEVMAKFKEPLAKAVNKLGKRAYEEAGEFFQAKHAIERNKELRKINPTFTDPAGMSDAQAQAILQRVARDPRRALFEDAYKKMRSLIDATLDMQVRDGLMSQQMANAWRQRWPDYVPMRHTEVGDMIGIGRGLDIRGKESQRAFGRLSRADNPIQYALMQMDRAIIRGAKNEVGEAVSNFVERAITSDPANRDLFSTTEKPTKQQINPKTGLVETVVDPNWRNDPNIFIWKKYGAEKHVYFKGEYGGQLIRALKNMQQQQAGEFVRAMSAATRFLARLNTSLNPEFIISNFVRDAGEAFINLPKDQQAALVKSFRKNLIPALSGAWKGQDKVTLRGGRWAQWYREFEAEGGKIGYYGAETAEEHSANFQKMLKDLQRGPLSVKKMGKTVIDGIDKVNTTIENATRLAVYVAARENGISKAKAAFMAREATVNFNRRGESRALSSAYMFANAGLQGTVRGVQALKSSPRARKAAVALAASGAALTTYNIFAGGTDKDGRSFYSKIPPWERQLNFIFMNPTGNGQYIKIPKPFFYGMFFGIGDHLASFAFDRKTAADTAKGIFWDAAKAVDPLGQDEGWAHWVPTIAKPLAQLALNENPWGNPIYPEEKDYSKYKSKAEGFHFRSTSEPAKWAARMLNQLGGGDKNVPGSINVGVGTISTDIHPEVIDYLTGFVTGGLGRFGMNMYTWGTRLYNGQEWMPEKTPFVRRFYGEAPQPGAERALYAEQRKEAEAAKQRKTPGPEMRSAPAFQEAQKANKKLYQEMDKVQKNDRLSEAEKDKRVKALEQKQLDNMLKARRTLERARAAQEKRKPTFAVGGLVRI